MARSETPILATKLFPPPLRPDLVFRPRLVDQLNAGGQHKLILVSAPAGYGKTTLVSCWLRKTGISSAWLSLDEDDNDPIRFFQCFLAAVQGAIPSVSGDFMSGQSMRPDTILNLLINEITRQTAPFVLVLDDFHNISSQAVLDVLTTLLERMPPNMQIVLLSRVDPPLPLSRLRARNQLIDVRAEQLRFTPDEIAVFLNDVMSLKLSASDLAAMEARTEGWIAGLQLAALSMHGSRDVHEFITAFAGSHYYIMDYLVEEVLTAQPEAIRFFLLQTSILDRMCASLCNAVVDTHDRDGIDGQDLLETLERKNLFVVRLDDERRWYRYHHLFADMLHRHLEHLFAPNLTALHLRASEWYEQNGLVPEAIRHSLAAGDQNRAVELIEKNGSLLLIRGDALSGLASCTDPQTVTIEGQLQDVTGTALDNGGNSATDPATVSIDKSAPTISAAADRAANINGWYNADVMVSFTCEDTLSGIASCPAAQTLGEGTNQSASGTATDAADNNSPTATVSGINVDKTAPTISAAATTGTRAM